MQKDKKEDIVKSILLSDPVDNGLICVLKTLGACRTAKVVGHEGKHFLKSSSTKCLHYYLYYLDKEFGFMFVKVQTWFSFNPFLDTVQKISGRATSGVWVNASPQIPNRW